MLIATDSVERFRWWPMKIYFGHTELDYPGAEMGELRDSNALLGDADALHARMAEDGYLLMRKLIDPAKVQRARQHIFEYMAEHEGLEPGSRPLDGVMGEYGKGVGLMGRKPITHDPAVRDVLEAEELFAFYENYFAEGARTFDYKWLRAVGNEAYTGAHFDFVYMGRGSARLHTCWIPFGTATPDHGTLAICVGSHRDASFERLRETYGRTDVDRDRTPGWFTNEPMEITEQFGGQWATTTFEPGDIITFGMHTMHASTTNLTDRWRLSCDVRFQPVSEPVDDRWVGDNPTSHRSDGPPKPPVSIEAARAAWGL